MEHAENDKLTDAELDNLLACWPAPRVPENLRTSLFGQANPWYSRLWAVSVRVPLPAVLVLLLALGFLVVETRRTAPPPSARENAPLGFRELHPVAELNPRIIRREHVGN